jgi:ligand-binding sensor domain-containing protein/AraC-like DNA-binding protein
MPCLVLIDCAFGDQGGFFEKPPPWTPRKTFNKKFLEVQKPFFKKVSGLFLCCFFFIFFILSTAIWGSFLETGGRRYTVTAWGIEDGLPRNSVLGLVQTREGFIWIGTQSGLVRFDGVGFRVYNRWNTPGLKNDYILCLYEDKNGALWVGTGGGGISRLKKGNWTAYTMGQGLPGNTVRAIAEDPDHALWIGTDNGLKRLEGEKIKTYSVEHGLSAFSVSALMADPDGTLWIGTRGGGLNRMKGGKLFAAPNFPGDAFAGREITVLHRDRSGSCWVGTDDGLYYIKNGIKKVFLAGNSIRALLEDHGGTLWVGTDGEGIYRLTTGANPIDIPAPVTTRQGFPDDFIQSLAQDGEGNLWVGTFTTGLVRLKESRVGVITTENGLPENRVHTLLQDHDGFLWAGSDRSGLARIDVKTNRVIRTYTTADGLSGNSVRALCADRDKNLWVGTTTGLNRVNITGNTFRVDIYTTKNGLASDYITALFQDRDGSLWIGTHEGLNRLKDGQFKLFGGKAGLSGILIRTVGEDRAGNLLVGTGAGLFLFSPQDNRFRNFAAEFTPSGQGQAPDFTYDVSAFHEDLRGYLWVGTNGSGLLRIKRQPGKPGTSGVYTLTPLTEADGLPNNYIFSITEDSSGGLWMSSYRGVFVLPGLRLSQTESDPPGFEPLTVVSFDEKEGMTGSECVMTGHPSAWKTREGKLYIPTVKGIAVFDLDVKGKTAVPPPPPPVIIENVIVDNRSVLWDEMAPRSFPVGIRVVEFYFAALSFSAPDKIRTWYKLEGFDRQWQEASPKQKRMVFYVNLPAGDYCFNVIACDNRGAWNYEGARFKFRISVPFHKSPLFYGLILLLAVLLVGGAARYAAARKKRARAAEEEKPEPGEKYKTSALLPETVEQVLPRLVRLMEEEKLFLDPGLTLKKLSERLHVHYNHLSRIINERLGKSFNDYINSYRIAEAKKKLADPREARKTILEIAYDTGFYSKSVFNTAFKKFTGMTPSRFKKTQVIVDLAAKTREGT